MTFKDGNILEKQYHCKIRESDEYRYETIDHYAYNITGPDFYRTRKMPLIDITMTQDNFRRLENDLCRTDAYRMEANEYYAVMKSNQEKVAQEQAKRERNPAAAKAYEKYLLLLNMTADNNGRT